MGLVVAWGLCALLWHIFVCIPVQSFWTLEAAMTSLCQKSDAFLLVSGITNVATDVILVAVPIIMLGYTALPLQKKIALAVVLSTGSL